MTAKTSEAMAAALDAAGLPDLAKRARADEFHDFLSPHHAPLLLLDDALVAVMKNTTLPQENRTAAYHVRMRMHEGEFDATADESDDWANSEEGRAVFRELSEDMKK